MKLKELEDKLNKCSFQWEVISLSRNWYWTSTIFDYKNGEKLLIEKEVELNKMYPLENIKNILILRNE